MKEGGKIRMKITETKVEAKLVSREFSNVTFYSIVVGGCFETIITKDDYEKLGGKKEKYPRDSKGRFIKRS